MMEDLKKAIADYWSAAAPTYDRRVGHAVGSKEEKTAWQDALRAILPPPPASILDVGMGTGFLIHLLKDLGYKVSGLDISLQMLSMACSRWPADDPATVVLADAETLPFGANQFDAVVSRFLLWTLPNPKYAIGEWTRVCRPRGMVLAIDGLWWQNNPAFRFRWALGTWIEWWHDLHLQKEPRPIYEDYYSPDIRKSLPLLTRPGPKPVEKLFQAVGLADIAIHNLPTIGYAERIRLPLRRRLMYQEKFAVAGSKKIVFATDDHESVDIHC